MSGNEESQGPSVGPPVGAVLAGGMGRRIGGRKQSRQLGGRALITYPLRALAEAGLDRLVVIKPGAAGELGIDPECEVVREPPQPVHPLLGIVTALEWARPRPVLALACDMPLLTPRLLAWIASRPARLAVPRVGGRLEPLAARYEPSLLAELRRGLEQEAPLTDLVESLRPLVLDESEIAAFGDPGRLMLNVNTAADLARVEPMLTQRN